MIDHATLAVILLAPFVFFAAVGSLMFVSEVTGPFITLGLWLAFLVYLIVWRRRLTVHVSALELIPVIGAIVILQLLLDLHTRYLGDIVVGALHVLYATGALLYRRRHGPVRALRDEPHQDRR